MNKYSLILFLAFSASCFAQPNLLNAKIPADIGKKTPEQIKLDNLTPLKYGYLDDRDVLFGKKIWEFVDIDERLNFPLYYPIKPLLDRISLFDVLKEYVDTSTDIDKFCFQDEYFSEKLDPTQMKGKFNYVKLTEDGEKNVNSNFNPNKIDMNSDRESFMVLVLKLIDDKKITEGVDYKTATLNASNIVGYKIQGYWYFDARLSEMKYRLLAIAPVAVSASNVVEATFSENNIEAKYEARKQGGVLSDADLKSKQEEINALEKTREPDALFWVYYPAIREVLKKHPAFNERNSAKPISFDDLLVAHRFHGMIYKEENTLSDREITKYISDNALGQLLESDRVKEKIRDLEHDMWTY